MIICRAGDMTVLSGRGQSDIAVMRSAALTRLALSAKRGRAGPLKVYLAFATQGYLISYTVYFIRLYLIHILYTKYNIQNTIYNIHIQYTSYIVHPTHPTNTSYT